jgi:phospholipid/cholesterol/gamma-HCH transport system substrate-binding protein
LKITKEIKTAIIALLAIGLFVSGINFLKGNSFFGGDDVYYAYFDQSGQLAPASSVTINGVVIGKVLTVEYLPDGKEGKKVKIKFNIQNEDVKLPVGSYVEVGAMDLLTKGLIVHLGEVNPKGFYKPGDALRGEVSVDMITQVKAYADPITNKLNGMVGAIDELVTSFSSFWDTTATSSIAQSMKELKTTISRFGNVAKEVEMLVADEKVKFGSIMTNVASITHNLKLSNDKITGILGDAQQLTADLVSADFKSVVLDAQTTLQKVNLILTEANNGTGTLGKLLGDQKLYDELVNTNVTMQNLVNDIQMHPERYIHFSILGAKSKGVSLNKQEEKRLRKILDTVK